MNDILPSLFLMGAGAYFLWTAARPEHAIPRLARVTGVALALLGAGALIFSIAARVSAH